MTKFADVIILNDNGEMLFLRRSWKTNFEPNKLCLPGGHVDPGEDFEVAAKRELKEETALDCKNIQFIQQRKLENGNLIDYFTAEVQDQYGDFPILILDENEHQGYEFRNLEQIKESQDDEYLLDLKEYLLENLESFLK